MKRNIAHEKTFQTISGQAWKECAYNILESASTTKSHSELFWQDLVLHSNQSAAQKLA
jgi:hypothetical protein